MAGGGKRWRQELRPWQRFYVRLALGYGIPVGLLLAVLSWWSYQQQVDAEMAGLERRLLVSATMLSAAVDGDWARADRVDGAEAYWKSQRPILQRIAQTDPEVADVYVMRLVEAPASFEILADHEEVHLDGTLPDNDIYRVPYDATEVPFMTAALQAPTVEDQVYVDEYGSTLAGYAPLRDSTGAVVGIVGLDVRASRLSQLERRALRDTLLAYLALFAAFSVVTALVSHAVVAPLAEFIDASDAVARGDLEVALDVRRTDEFGLLGRHFAQMITGLQERDFIREVFGRYVSPKVAENLLRGAKAAQLGGELREVTVLFSDLAGYSSLTESASPTEVVSLLNEYFGAMNSLIEDHGGVVIEFLGDGILAVFGAPMDQPEHTAQAVHCAVAMRQRLSSLNVTWRQSGTAELWKDLDFDDLGVRIGLHVGQVIAGNLGSPTRLKYAVIGDTVNVAARLEQLNKELGTSLAVSGDVVRALPLRSFPFEARGQVAVKGRRGSVEVFTL